MGTVRALDVEGYIAAPVLPMRDDGAIDLDTMERYVRWIADDGPKAIVVNSSAGEGELLYSEERAQVLERVVGAVGSRLPVVAGDHQRVHGGGGGPGAGGGRAGAAGLLVFPPRAFGGEGLPAPDRGRVPPRDHPGERAAGDPVPPSGAVRRRRLPAETLRQLADARGRGRAEGGELRRDPLHPDRPGEPDVPPAAEDPDRQRHLHLRVVSARGGRGAPRHGGDGDGPPDRDARRRAARRPGHRGRAAGPARPAVPGDLRAAPPELPRADEGGAGLPGDAEERGRAGSSASRHRTRSGPASGGPWSTRGSCRAHDDRPTDRRTDGWPAESPS